MIIRKANMKDLKDIVRLNFELDKFERKWYPYPILNLKNSENWIRRNFSGKDAEIFIAVNNKKVVGYVFGWVHNRQYHNKIKKFGYCSDLFVLEEYRRSGIGKKLVKKFEEWCRGKGMIYLELSTNIKNKVGRKVYPSLGFKEFGIKYMKKIK